MIRKGADWLTHMQEQLAGLASVAELEEAGPTLRRTVDLDPDLGGSAKIGKLLRELGTQILDGNDINPGEIAELSAPRGSAKHQKAERLILHALDHPDEIVERVFGKHFRAPALPPQRIVLEETVEQAYDHRYRRDFLMSRYPELLQRFDSDHDREALWVDPLIESNRRGFTAEIPKTTSIAEVVFNAAMEVNQNWIGELGTAADDKEGSYETPVDSFLNSKVFKLTERACCDLLSVPPGNRLEKGCRWDRAQYQAILLHPANQKAIRGWVVGQLVRSGDAPKLAAIFDRRTS